MQLTVFGDSTALNPMINLKIDKNFQNSPSHRIFERMHEALNIDKNKT
jgi:hypothetical protein